MCVYSVTNAQANAVYLTFDDGPLGGTENILKALEEENTPGAFFMVGMHVERSEGHKRFLQETRESIYVLLGNHSYSHALGRYQEYYSDSENVKEDIEKNNKLLGIETQEPIHTRLPGRDVFRLPNLRYDDPFISQVSQSRESVVYDAVFKANFHLYGWDHEWDHSSNGAPIQSVEKLTQEIKECFANKKTLVPGELILLAHDQMFRNEYNGQNNLQHLIRMLRKEGYTIANLREYNTAQKHTN